MRRLSGFPRTLNAIGVMNEVFEGNGIQLPLPSQKTLTGESEDERYRKGLDIQNPLYGTEIADRYTWLPGDFAQAVPRFLTELCFGDFNTRSGLDGKTANCSLLCCLLRWAVRKRRSKAMWRAR